MREGDCSIERLVNAVWGKPTDRVPNFEALIMARSVEALVGVPLGLTEFERQFRSTMRIGPYEYVHLCQKLGMDAMCLLPFWTVVSRKGELEGGAKALSQRPAVHDWNELDKLDNRPSMDAIMARIRDYKRAAAGTGIGLCTGSRSVLCNTYETLGFENCMIKLHDDPALVRKVMDIYLDYALELTEALLDEGIDIFYLDDDIAMHNGFVVHPRVIETEWYPRTEKIVQLVHKKGLPILMHCCGNLTDVVPLALRLGVNAIHPFEPYSNDIYAVKKQYGDRLTLVGNIDIAGVLAFGTPDEVAEDTREHIERLDIGGRHVCCSSHSITDAVPPENFLAMVEACHTYGIHN